MRVIVDGDILVYRAGYASQSTSYQFVSVDGTVVPFKSKTRTEALQEALERGYVPTMGKLQKITTPDSVEFTLHTCKNMMNDIINKTGADEFEVYLTANNKSNYRFKIATIKPYKGNRTQPKPIRYDKLREYLVEVWGAVVVDGIEADDAMGIAQMQMPDSMICSIDKDMHMVPGKHFNFVTNEAKISSDPGELRLRNNRKKLEGTGLKWFYAQMLLGDSADNIPGIPKHGPVKVHNALEPLQTEKDMLYYVYIVYTKYYGKIATQALLEVADLLWIQRKPNERKSEHLRTLLEEILNDKDREDKNRARTNKNNSSGV